MKQERAKWHKQTTWYKWEQFSPYIQRS